MMIKFEILEHFTSEISMSCYDIEFSDLYSFNVNVSSLCANDSPRLNREEISIP